MTVPAPNPAQPNGYPVDPVIDGNLTLVDPYGLGQWGILKVPYLTLGNFPNVQRVLGPSGDTSGALDAAAINAVFAAAGSGGICLTLLPGIYYINTPIIINRNGQVLAGSGWDSTFITCQFTASQQAMVILGNTVIVSQPVLRDLTIWGVTNPLAGGGFTVNSFSGHGCIIRANSPVLMNVDVKQVAGRLYSYQPNDILAGSGTATQAVGWNLQGSFPGASFDGLYLDSATYDSEFVAAHLQGAVNPSRTGANGINDLGGGNKLVVCHPYGFSDAAALLQGVGHQVWGGEYESCGAQAISVVGTVGAGTPMVTKILGPQCYNNGGGPLLADIEISDNATWVRVDAGWLARSTATTYAVAGDGTVLHIKASNGDSSTAKGIHFASGADHLIIVDNDLSGAAVMHSATVFTVTGNI